MYLRVSSIFSAWKVVILPMDKELLETIQEKIQRAGGHLEGFIFVAWRKDSPGYIVCVIGEDTKRLTGAVDYIELFQRQAEPEDFGPTRK